METQATVPHGIVVRLGNDMNWWVEKATEDIYWPREGLSILDPRQFRDVAERLEELFAVGLPRVMFAKAFVLYAAESEEEEGRLRLKIVQKADEASGAKLFALPLFANEDESTYRDLVENLIEMRVKLLNQTHRYARPADPLDLEEELLAKANDRYFDGGNLHCYDEVNEILSWSPAEWDGSDEITAEPVRPEEDEEEKQS